jgi:hypothetical protein
MIFITKSSNPTQSHHIHHKVNSHHIMNKAPCKSSHVANTWLVGVTVATSQSGLVLMWTWSSIVTDRRMQKLNEIKRIVNGKDFYIDGKNMKTDLREIYLSSRRWAKWRWSWLGEQGTATCQILVVPPFAIHVVMQRMSFKIIPNYYISCNEITQLTWSIACYCAKQAA